jgi:hypothetical protein
MHTVFVSSERTMSSQPYEMTSMCVAHSTYRYHSLRTDLKWIAALRFGWLSRAKEDLEVRGIEGEIVAAVTLADMCYLFAASDLRGR